MAVPKSPCQYCGKSVTTTYLPTHVRTQHGIYGGMTGRPRRRTKEDFSQPTEHPAVLEAVIEDPNRLFDNAHIDVPQIEVPASPNHASSFKVAPFLLLEDQDGGLWIAEKLR